MLRHLEEIITRSCLADCKNNFYKIYLADTFACFDNEIHAYAFLNSINNFHPNIKFTMEVQRNNFLSFLDLLVITNVNQVSTYIYSNQTLTGLCLSFFSYCALKF